MPPFIEPQLARLVDAPPNGVGWAHEVKFDGYRMQLRVENGRARFRTRKGLDWSDKFPEIVRDAARLPNCVIDGEVCALDDKGGPDFGRLQIALSDGKTDHLIFYVFDLLFLDGNDFRNQPLSGRKQVLEQLLKQARIPPRVHYVRHFTNSGAEMLKGACEMGLEGIISKRLTAPYATGRGDFWVKSKCRGGQEVVIGGWWGDANTMRSLCVGVYDNGKFTYVGNVGTGFNARNAPDLLKALRPLKRPTSPFEAGPKPPRPKEVNWVEPKLVAEIEFAGFTHDGNVRQAAFKGLRADKPAKAVTRERAVAAPSETKVRKEEAEVKKKSAIVTTKSVTSKEDAVVGGVTITHANKPLWPAHDGARPVTKLDLANYFEAAADLMLPHIAGRPLSIVRAPDGINGQLFYQRHILPGMKFVHPIRAKGEVKPYLFVDDLKGLLELAQFGVTEMHPWGCLPNDPETPEILIFDIDPEEGLPFARVIDAAKELRERLQACGLATFVKTTGGKGIHVVTAIKGTPKNKLAWPPAKEFARLLCEKMAADARDKYTTNMSKKVRRGRIFLDYLRNDRTSTAVGPYSPRGRPGATIALPIPWNQVSARLDPKGSTILTAKSFLKRADPWKDLHKSAVALELARKKLDKM